MSGCTGETCDAILSKVVLLFEMRARIAVAYFSSEMVSGQRGSLTPNRREQKK